MKRIAIISSVIIAVTVIIAIGFATGQKDAHSKLRSDMSEAEKMIEEKSAIAQETSLNVYTRKLETVAMVDTLQARGKTTADEDVTYSAESAGKIEMMAVDLGDYVRKGQILARVDYQMAKAQVESAQAAYDLAKVTYERLEPLKKDDLISQQSIDEARTQLMQAEAQLKIAKVNFDKSVLRADFSGIVVGKFAERGEYATPGKPLFRVVNLNEIVITADIPETSVADVKKGQQTSVRIKALGKDFTGEIDTLLPVADPESRMFQVRIRLNNKGGLIKAGMAALINIELESHDDVILAPQEAVVETATGSAVFVAKEGVAQMRNVRLGASKGEEVVLAEGVQAGEALIVIGQRDLVDGQPVKVVKK